MKKLGYNELMQLINAYLFWSYKHYFELSPLQHRLALDFAMRLTDLKGSERFLNKVDRERRKQERLSRESSRLQSLKGAPKMEVESS